MSGTTTNQRLKDWVSDWAAVMQPADIYWCDGSADEYERLCQELVDSGTFTKLDEAKRPNSYWAHSDPGDVARVEDRTYICSATEDEAGCAGRFAIRYPVAPSTASAPERSSGAASGEETFARVPEPTR